MKLNKEDLPPTDGVWECNGMRWCSWLNGQLHNSLGPAVIICDDGSKQWWVDGKIHRLDGPAVEWLMVQKSGGSTDKESLNKIIFSPSFLFCSASIGRRPKSLNKR